MIHIYVTLLHSPQHNTHVDVETGYLSVFGLKANIMFYIQSYRIAHTSDHARHFSNCCNIYKVVYGNQLGSHCNQSDTQLFILLPELYEQTPSSLPHQTCTHAHTDMYALSHCAAFFFWGGGRGGLLEPVKQNNSQYI